VGSLLSCLAADEAEGPRAMAWSRKSYRCSRSARQWRRAPLDLAKMKGTIRSGRKRGFQREWPWKRRGRDDGNLHRGFPHGTRARSSSPWRGRAEGVGCGFGWRCWWPVDANEQRDNRERGLGAIYLVGRSRWPARLVVESWRALAWVGGGVAELGPSMRGTLAFGRMQVDRGAGTDVPTDRSPPCAQVFDGGGGGLTGKGVGAAAPVECWGGVELVCVNEIDRGRVWGRERERVQGDAFGAGWGWLGGVGAREREWLRLGNTRGAGVSLRALVWSEGQREGVELEVVYLGFCQGEGEGRGKRGTPGADRWGGVVY
jgi:hypothetical protein